MSSVINAQGLSKRYLIDHQQKLPYKSLRDVIARNAKKWLTKPHRLFAKAPSNSPTEEFWALRDVDFVVNQGDRVGIIGRNGAGKSTLLKIFSRITDPTKGRVEIRGRIASLLEVGTGFHPELTGRENIFLNAAILGMSKADTRKRFDEIVNFADVERFLDTPVKRYSSGMYVRLAFAVAAHLEPEILILDEILAVGDSRFQSKCLGKIEDVTREGRTILFVSHNMAAIEKLCTRAILLKQGRVVLDASTSQVISGYLDDEDENGHIVVNLHDPDLATSAPPIQVTSINILSADGSPARIIQTGDGVWIRIRYIAQTPMNSVPVAFVASLKSHFDQELIRLSTMPISGYEIDRIGTSGYIDLKIDSLPLTSGKYLIDISVTRPNIETLLTIKNAIALFIERRDIYDSGVALDQQKGLFVVKHQWDLQID